jgi:tetratricopeptide (TPR) repeat protein
VAQIAQSGRLAVAYYPMMRRLLPAPRLAVAPIVAGLLLLLAPPVAVSSVAAAVAEIEARAAADPGNLRLRFQLARACVAAGDVSRGIALYNEILARRRAPSVMFHLGLAHARTGELEKSILLWLEILSSDNPQAVSRPLSTMTMVYLASALHKQKNHDQALVWWRRVLEVEPAHEKARLYAGAGLYRMGRFKEAAREWLLLMKSRPSTASLRKAMFLLGQAFVALSDAKKATRVFRRLLELEPGHAGATRALARLKANQLPPVPPPAEATREQDAAVAAIPSQPPSAVSTQQAVDPTREPPVPAPPPAPPGFPAAEIPNLRAEEQFLDGLDQKEKGNHEKALFHFLQALDVDPRFTQVHLQVGEVYLHLARLAPTPNQFKERLTLALQSLEKVGILAPNTLLAHSAQGKIVQARKMEKEGFFRHHLAIAQAAFNEGREQDAFEEYILLLSNKHFQDDIFLALAKILPRLSAGNRQDLQFFLEDLSGKNEAGLFVPYVLSLAYLKGGRVPEGKIAVAGFLDRLAKLDPREPAAGAYRAHAGGSRADLTDRYLLGCYLAARGLDGEAEKALRDYLDRAKKDAPFADEAARRLEALRKPVAAPDRVEDQFNREKEELVRIVPRAAVLLGENVERGHADETVAGALRTLVQGRPENGLARFCLAWVLTVRADRMAQPAATHALKEADDLFMALLREKWQDADWHFRLAVTGLAWGLDDRARSHLKVSGDILLAQGRPVSTVHGRVALAEARVMLHRGLPRAAELLARQALVYDHQSVSYHLVKYELDSEAGHPISALWNLVEWARKALGSPWPRMVAMTDLGLHAITVLLLALVATAAALVLRHFEPLHHFVVEYLRTKGLALSAPLAIVLSLLVLPTGFLVVIPVLLWSLMSKLERYTYVTLALLLVAAPLALPISFEENFPLIRMVHEVNGGSAHVARPYFEERVKRDEHDVLSRFMLGVVYLKLGRADPAQAQFSRLLEQDPYDVSVLVNLAVAKARKGDYRRAKDLLAQALGRQPANVPALFDMMSIHGATGQPDKAEQYRKWAMAAAREGDQLPRFAAFYSDVPHLVLMDHPVDPARLAGLVSFLSGANLFGFHAPVLRMAVWVLAGGGLLAWLVLAWQRLDFVLARCSVCLRVVCNHCKRSAAGSKLVCVECFDAPRMDRDRQKALTVASAGRLNRIAVRKALVANLIVPGTGLAFAEHAPVGAFLALLFLTFLLAWWQQGGVLAAIVFPPLDLPVARFLLWVCLALALGIYCLAQGAFYQVKDDIRGA